MANLSSGKRSASSVFQIVPPEIVSRCLNKILKNEIEIRALLIFTLWNYTYILDQNAHCISYCGSQFLKKMFENLLLEYLYCNDSGQSTWDSSFVPFVTAW